MATYNIEILNGKGEEAIENGSYTASLEATGYDTASLDPTAVTIVDGTNEYDFTVAAAGTLTLHVTETGTTEGTPIVGATFYRTDAEGNTYGSAITTNANGEAVFSNVPYAATGAPTVYYKQTASDGSHGFSEEVASATLTDATLTVEVMNPANRTINLTDANYTNLPVGSATITLAENA